MTIDRVSLPNEFFDLTSAVMLKQPEPQYIFAQMLFIASGQAELQRAERLGISPERSVGGVGAPVGSLAEMQLMLSDTIRGEAILVSDELAPGKVGHTVRMNRPIFGGGGYTISARSAAAGQSISTVPIDVTSEQVAITIQRFAGPYDSTNSRVAPYAVDRFDAQHSVHNLAQIVGLHMARDRMKWLDKVLSGLYDTVASGNILFPGDSTFSLSADSSAFTTNVNGDRPFDAETVYRTEQKLADLNIPRFANGKYMMILTPQQARQLRSDFAYRQDAVYETDYNPLRNSYIKTLGNVELYASTTNPVDTSTVSGVSINHAIAFGPGHVGYAQSGPARVAASTDDNYGEQGKVIWLAYEGFSVLDSRMAVSVHSN